MKLQKMKNGSYFVTVPKPLVRAKGWNKGEKVSWEVNDEGRLGLK